MTIFVFFFTNSCTQNLISYIKTSPKKPLISIEDILVESGLIYPNDTKTITSISNQIYPTGTLITNTTQLKITYHTVEVTNNSPFTITIPTKNYLIVTPYYSSAGIVYLADESTPKQGIFKFIISGSSGITRMRIYSADGFLQEEQVWYVEVL